MTTAKEYQQAQEMAELLIETEIRVASSYRAIYKTALHEKADTTVNLISEHLKSSKDLITYYCSMSMVSDSLREKVNDEIESIDNLLC